MTLSLAVLPYLETLVRDDVRAAIALRLRALHPDVTERGIPVLCYAMTAVPKQYALHKGYHLEGFVCYPFIQKMAMRRPGAVKIVVCRFCAFPTLDNVW